VSRTRRLRRAALLLLGATVATIATRVEAQLGGRSFETTRIATPEDFDGRFHFCRIEFRNGFGGQSDGNWAVDFPRADINLSIRLAELTRTDIGRDANDNPHNLLLNLTAPELFDCPFIMMTEVGSAELSNAEVQQLREYLLKGGFLWADDFWGEYAWRVWMEQLGKALPPAEFPAKDLPADHPLFRTVYDVGGVPQIASIGYWWGSGGDTSERGLESAEPHARGVFDASGRLMVLMTHNTDIGDSWEEEASNPRYFYEFSTKGYAFGINAIVYALTH
jgi:hypothetical protein